MANDIATYLKYANLQMAAESLFGILPTNAAGFTKGAGSMTEVTLTDGNKRSSKFTTTQAKEFASLWEVVEHISNTPTGFSGTLFKAKAGSDAALRAKYGITEGELTLSFRSTEFADDAARDNQATNALEIRKFGYAFGQIADMQNWVKTLPLNGSNVTVTGYSLGGHLAAAFRELNPAVAGSTYTFNGAGIGKPVAGGLQAVITEFNARRQTGANTALFTNNEVKNLYISICGLISTDNNSAPTLAQIDTARGWARDLMARLLNPTTPSTAGLQAKLLYDALDRDWSVAEEALRVKNNLPNGDKPAQGVDLRNISAIGLDYQLAVLTVGQKTESYGDINAVAKALGTLSRTEENRPNYYDVYGDTNPSMVSNSQRHLGAGTKVWIEDQPEARGSVGAALWNSSTVATGVKLLVPNFSENDFGDTHSLVLLVDSLTVQNTLAMFDNKLTQDSASLILKAASNSKVLTDTPTQGKADGDSLENVVNGLAAVLGIKADLKGNPSGGTWALIRTDGQTRAEGDFSDRNDFHDKLAAISKFVKDNELAGKFEITPAVGISKKESEETYKDFASILGLINGASFGIKAKDAVSREFINDKLLAVSELSKEHVAFTKDKTLREQKGDLKQLNYTDSYLNDRAAYVNSLIELNSKNTDPITGSVSGVNGKVINFEDVKTGKKFIASDVLSTSTPGKYLFGSDKSEAGQTALNGLAGEDHIYGGDGDDEINSLAGDDYIEGNAGADKLFGGDGKDVLLGGEGDDKELDGGAGVDHIYGGAGADKLIGGSDGDFLYGDFLDPDANSADSGDDTLVGGDGIDTLYGGQGNDTLYGDQESEASLEAFGWGDTLYGGKGNDILYGGSGNDRLEGGEGDDTITGGAGNDILMGGEGIDIYKFGSAADYFGKDTITDSDGKGSLQINGQTLGGTFTSYGERGAYRLKLADGSSAGLSVYNDTTSNTGKSAILKFSGNLTNQITIRNFDEAAAKGGQGFMGIKIDPKQAVLVKASNYATAPNPFQAWDFDPTTFAAGADSSITERNGKSFTVYLQQGASANSTLILNIAGAVGQGLKAILGDSVVDANGAEHLLRQSAQELAMHLVAANAICTGDTGLFDAKNTCKKSEKQRFQCRFWLSNPQSAHARSMRLAGHKWSANRIDAAQLTSIGAQA